MIREVLRVGEELKQGRASVEDVLIMPESVGTDDSGTEQKGQLLQRIAGIAKHYELAQQFRQKLQAVSRRIKPKQHRKLRYKFARCLVNLSRIYRQIQFTPPFQGNIIDLIRQAVEKYKPAEREIAKIQRKLEECLLTGLSGLPELRTSLRQLTQDLRKMEKDWGWGATELQHTFRTIERGQDESETA